MHCRGRSGFALHGVEEHAGAKCAHLGVGDRRRPAGAATVRRFRRWRQVAVARSGSIICTTLSDLVPATDAGCAGRGDETRGGLPAGALSASAAVPSALRIQAECELIAQSCEKDSGTGSAVCAKSGRRSIFDVGRLEIHTDNR